MLSNNETEFYYNHWLNSILKMYIKNFGIISWKSTSELLIKKTENRILWDKKVSDNFIYNTKHDKTLLGKDILARGMYFPFFTIDNYVLLGYHRLLSLQLINTDKKFMCVELNKNHIGDSLNKDFINDGLKYDNNKNLGFSLKLEIPRDFQKPFDSRDEFDYLVLKNNQVKKDRFIEIEVNTYRDLIDVLKITPHWIKNDFYKYNTQPSPIVNSQEEFNKWIQQ